MSRPSQNVQSTLQEAHIRVSLATRVGVTRLSATLDKCNLGAVLEWLSTLKFSEQHLEFDRHFLGTCNWFLSLEEFVAWKSREKQTLYCSAIGGAGKTVLVSVVVDTLRMTVSSRDVGISMIYCKHDKPDSHEMLKVAMTLLKQVVQIRAGRILLELEKLLKEHLHTKDTRPDLTRVLEVLNALLSKYSELFLIVDGLDEISNDEARLNLIMLHLKLTGRPYVYITVN
ncbi:MAG: hypothetical protein MMC33_008427 [Icmadophila ericetorum]|nr:hypothetical protein [Icmadophila ericetorum]